MIRRAVFAPRSPRVRWRFKSPRQFARYKALSAKTVVILGEVAKLRGCVFDDHVSHRSSTEISSSKP